MLVGLAVNDKFEDFPIARSQCCDTRANGIQRARRIVMRNGPPNCLKKQVDDTGFIRKSNAPALMVRTAVGISR